MTTYYTLNLGFDLDHPTYVEYGEFLDPPTSIQSQPPLQQSKRWLISTEPPTTATSFIVQPDRKVTVNHSDQIWIRYFSPKSSADITLRITVLFGRKGNGQNFRTPFSLPERDDGLRVAQAVFDSGFNEAGPDGSWMTGLGNIVNAPTTPPTYHFGFVAAATMLRHGKPYTFGHDPEMDVSMGTGTPHAAGATV